MFERICGLETEYGITCASLTAGKQPPLDADHAARELFEPIIEKHKTSNVFLPNGGRLYLDVGSHPEYATAECRTLRSLLAQDNAGDLLFFDMARQVNERFAQREFPGKIHLLKNNLDSQGNSCGCHENYLLHRRRDFRQVADAIVTFFITRQILVGAGHIEREPRPRYCFSQRADQMWDAVSAASTRSRPIINTRDEPLADGDKYRRMHVIVGDTNIAQPTTALKVGSTLLLLRAIEHGLSVSDIAISRPMQAIREISKDFTGQTRLDVVNGHTMSAIDIQQKLFDRITAHSSFDTDVDPLIPYLCDLWQRGLDALRHRDFSAIDTELDWAIKYRLIDEVIERKGTDLGSYIIARINFAYHDIIEGLRESMEATGRMKRLIPLSLAEQAKTIPPVHTRATLRGKVLAFAQEHREDITADWYHIRIDNSQHPTVTLKDPFATHDDSIDTLMNVLEQRYRQREAEQHKSGLQTYYPHTDEGRDNASGEVLV